MDQTKIEFHPRWHKNLDELNQRLTKKSLQGFHITSNHHRFFSFERGDAQRFEYVIITKRSNLKKEMLTDSYQFVFSTHRFSLYRKAEPLKLFHQHEAEQAQDGDLIQFEFDLDSLQIELFEKWLSDQAANGYLFYRSDSPRIYIFMKDMPQKIIYRTDFQPEIQDYSKYDTEIRLAGWSLVWTDGVKFYYRNNAKEPCEIFRDHDSKFQYYQRLLKVLQKLNKYCWVILLTGILELLSIPVRIIFSDGVQNGIYVLNGLDIGDFIILGLVMIASILNIWLYWPVKKATMKQISLFKQKIEALI